MKQRQIFRLARNLFFLLLSLISNFNVQAQAIWDNTSFVHRQNQQILNGQNTVIKLDGVNLGGWLMWEGWIWGGGFTAEKDINTNMQSIIGSTATSALFIQTTSTKLHFDWHDILWTLIGAFVFQLIWTLTPNTYKET